MEQSHHHINQSPIQWYSASSCSSTPLTSTPISNSAVPIAHWTPPRSLKRALSESDCDDLYSEESSSKDQ